MNINTIVCKFKHFVVWSKTDKYIFFISTGDSIGQPNQQAPDRFGGGWWQHDSDERYAGWTDTAAAAAASPERHWPAERTYLVVRWWFIIYFQISPSFAVWTNRKEAITVNIRSSEVDNDE